MTTTFSPDGIAVLAHWGVIRAQGAEAASFLHGQLTNDFSRLDPSHARLAGYCSAKGRLLASFIGWKNSPEEVLLACSADLLAPTLKRLSMFVLRAKCKLGDASTEWRLFGLSGPSAQAWIGSAAPTQVWGRGDHAGGSLIRLPDLAGQPRFLWAAGPGAEAPALPSIPLEAWRLGDILGAVPSIEAVTVDRFVPQMLNFELLGGVDFKKGCYPGQEVVARSQYRGTTKRRSFVFDCPLAARSGEDIFHSEDPGQPAGMVVNAAPLPGGAGSGLLAEVKLAALKSGTLHLGAPGGPILSPRPMPYEIDRDVTA